MTHWLQEIERRCRKVARAAPEFADRAARLLASLAMASAQLPEPPASLIHGDFHPEQVWIDEGRVVLFDFDEFARGRSRWRTWPSSSSSSVRIDPGARFATLLLAAYAQAAPGQFSQRRLHWHLAVQQLLQASRAFVFQIEGWRGHLELRLARAEALCPTRLPGVHAMSATTEPRPARGRLRSAGAGLPARAARGACRSPRWRWSAWCSPMCWRPGR